MTSQKNEKQMNFEYSNEPAKTHLLFISKTSSANEKKMIEFIYRHNLSTGTLCTSVILNTR